MLLIHWSKHKNTNDILKNGIRLTKKRISFDGSKTLKGIWCFPFTRNKTLNNNWKRNLKTWEIELSNFNGFVFKLEDSDFPIYAGEFGGISLSPEESKYENREEFLNVYGKYFSPKVLEFEYTEVDMNEGHLDYQDFEIIIPNRIEGKRIIKTIKDRKTLVNT